MTTKRRFGIVFALLLALAVVGRAPSARAEEATVLGPDAAQALGPFLIDGDLRALPNPEPGRQMGPEHQSNLGIGLGGAAVGEPAEDPVLQRARGLVDMPAPLISFAGLPDASYPSDANGDVGPNHYVQAVNFRFAVFAKTGGSSLTGSKTFTALYASANGGAGTGTPCDTNDKGDPIVLYDYMADRWLLSNMAWASDTGPHYECLAISRSGDPVAGGWYAYAVLVDSTKVMDYPKLSLWPDAYYLTGNVPGFGGIARVFALNRSAMLEGRTMATVSFDIVRGGRNFPSPLSANVRGAPPPAGAPALFADVATPVDFATPANRLYLWRFHVDWVNTANSWFGASAGNPNPVTLTVADYFAPPYFPPQPAPGPPLEAHPVHLMYGLQYRKVGGVESLWAYHTVDVRPANVHGLRWYEVRDPNGTPVVYQQGTFTNGNDGVQRFMGSLAADRFGNMAIGYSVSNGATVFPGLRYAGRLVGDPLGALAQNETTLIAGGGAYTCGGASCRWGDYSSMSVDPTDDCTFWYTGQYMASTNTKYSTRIGAFQFPGCAPLIVDRSDNGTASACTSAPNDCTLRGAINRANEHGGYLAISFDPSIAEIEIGGSLPVITGPRTEIRGRYGVPRIDGRYLVNAPAFTINAADVAISGLSIVNVPGAPGDEQADIHVIGGTRIRIHENYLGTLPPQAALTNCTPAPATGAVTRNAAYGVRVDAAVSSGSVYTGTAAVYIYNNTIGCHSQYGVFVNGADRVIIGEDPTANAGRNWIGVNSSSVPLPNTLDGVALLAAGSNGAQSNVARNNIIAANGRNGVWVKGSGANNSGSSWLNRIQANRIGLTLSSARGNRGHGILLSDGAFNNLVGGPAESDRNIISGNEQDGVHIAGSDYNGIIGNTIGVNVAGTAALANAGSGIVIDGGKGNSVGRYQTLLVAYTRGNVVSGNAGDGVQIIAGASETDVILNYIGTDAAGSAAIPNGLSGVALFLGAHDNVIGGSSSAQRNVIGGNARYGVFIADNTTTLNTVGYNDIGLNTAAAGLALAGERRASALTGADFVTIPNGWDGLTIQNNAHHNTVNAANMIARNSHSGIYIAGGAHHNTVDHTFVFENRFYGVLFDGPSTLYNVVSYSQIYANGTAGRGYDGIAGRNGADKNVWTRVSMYDNAGLGIDRMADSDATNTINAPAAAITSVTRAGGTTTIRGAGPNGKLIELYRVAPDPSGFGEGKTFVADAVVAGGRWTITDTGGGGCYTLIEAEYLITASEFGLHNCRTFLPVFLR